MHSLLVLIVSLVVGVSGGGGPEPVRVDEALPSYQRGRGVVGSLKSIGSDTLNNVMAEWGDEFKKFYPNVSIEIEGKGSKTAPPALIEGQAQFGPMSREMKADEIDAFEERFGYKPTAMRTGIDCLAVFVHKDCPLDAITLSQLRRVYSVDGPIMTWGDLGVTESKYRSTPVSLYGRNSASGTYDFFKQFAIAGKDYKATVKEQGGSSGVIQAVGADPFGMGYSGVGYATADVKMLNIAGDDGLAFGPSYENALSGDYPLARFLLVYVNFDERRRLDPLRAEFIRLIYSREGQEAVMSQGYYPVPAAIAREELTRFGLEPGL